jgi:hypothetical protein
MSPTLNEFPLVRSASEISADPGENAGSACCKSGFLYFTSGLMESIHGLIIYSSYSFDPSSLMFSRPIESCVQIHLDPQFHVFPANPLFPQTPPIRVFRSLPAFLFHVLAQKY